MKKLLEKNLVSFLFFLTLIICVVLSQKKIISLFPVTKNQEKIQEVTGEILFSEEQYKLAGSMFDPSTVKEIASFGNLANTGEGQLDYSDYLTGSNSLLLNSYNRHRSVSIVTLKEETRLGDFDIYKLLIDSRTEPANIEELNLFLENDRLQKKFGLQIYPEFPGWSVVSLPKDRFAFIEKITVPSTAGESKDDFSFNKIVLELVSRSEKADAINFDLLWGEQKNNLDSYWLSATPWSISLKRTSEGVVFSKYGIGSRVAGIKALSSVKNFAVSGKFFPLSTGYFGFQVRGDWKDRYGYYAVLDGVPSSSWRIFKRNTSKEGIFGIHDILLAKGRQKNFMIDLNRWYWLKIVMKNNILKFYLSLDGEKYVQLGQVKDNSFASGEIGIVSEVKMLLIDEIQFSQ